jgi:hypothetical protein
MPYVHEPTTRRKSQSFSRMVIEAIVAVLEAVGDTQDDVLSCVVFIFPAVGVSPTC